MNLTINLLSTLCLMLQVYAIRYQFRQQISDSVITIEDLYLTGDGTMIVSSSPYGAIYSYNSTSAYYEAKYYPLSSSFVVNTLAMSADKTQIVYIDRGDVNVALYQFNGLGFAYKIKLQGFMLQDYNGVVIKNDNLKIITHSEAGAISFFGMNPAMGYGTSTDSMQVSAAKISEISADGQLYIVSLANNDVKFFEYGSGVYTLIHTFAAVNPINVIRISQNSSYVVFGTSTNVQIYSLQLSPLFDFNLAHSITPPQPVTGLSFTQDMNIIIISMSSFVYIAEFNGVYSSLELLNFAGGGVSDAYIDLEGKRIVVSQLSKINVYVRCNSLFCSQCGQPDVCITCKDGFVLSNTNFCECSGFILSQQCIPCDVSSNCKRCTDATSCTQCWNNYQLVDQNICQQIVVEVPEPTQPIVPQQSIPQQSISQQIASVPDGQIMIGWWVLLLIAIGGTLLGLGIILLWYCLAKNSLKNMQIEQRKTIHDGSNIIIKQSGSKIMLCEPGQQINYTNNLTENKTEMLLDAHKKTTNQSILKVQQEIKDQDQGQGSNINQFPKKRRKRKPKIKIQIEQQETGNKNKIKVQQINNQQYQ